MAWARLMSESITSELITITGNELIVPVNRESTADHESSPSSDRELIAEIVDDSFCRNCGRSIAPDDNFCGRCGQHGRGGRQSSGECRDVANVAVPTMPPPSNSLQVVDSVLKSRFAVLALIATLGPLGLVALWISPSFSSPTKTMWTLGYLLVAVVMPIAIAIYWLDFSVRPLVDVLGG